MRLLDERISQQQASSTPLTSAELKEFKKQLKEEVYQQFKKKSMGDNDELQELLEELNQQINQRISVFKTKNIEKWNHTLIEWISNNSSLEENLKEDKYKNYFEFKVEFDKLQQKFEKEAPTGINKDQAWKEYSQGIFALAAECISKKAEDLNNGQQRIMAQKVEMLEKELTTKRKDYETEKEQLYHQIHQFERERGYSKAQENSTKDVIENLRIQKEKYEKLYNETIERGRDREDKIENEGKAKINDLEAKLEKMRGETLSKTVDLEKRNALLEQEMVFVRRENDDIKRKYEALDNERRELLFNLKQKETYIEECKKELAQFHFGKTQDIHELKLELENKIKELSNDESKRKDDLKQHHEWQMEKFTLENQIQYLSIQLDETKKLHKGLLTAIENGRTGNETEGNMELVQTNKNLSAAMENMEVRCKLFEEKVEKLKKYKRMIRNASALQCVHCSKFISCSIFPQHIKNCVSGGSQPSPISNPNLIKTITPVTQYQSVGGLNIEPYSLRVAINQTAVKESADSKPYTEFMIQVSYNTTKWTIAKQYKHFCELHHSLSTQFPNLKLPESALAILGTFSNANYAPNTKRPDIIEERRKSLEQYLKELIKIDTVRNSSTLQKFLVIDQVSKASSNSGLTANALMTQRLNLTSYRDDSKRMDSGLNSRANVDEELLASDLGSSIGPSNNVRPDMTSRFQESGGSIFSVTSPKGRFERTLPPTSPKSFLDAWNGKPLSKENTMPRSRGTSEDACSKGVKHHLVKDSYRPQHTQLKLNELSSGRFLSDTPNKLLQDLMANNNNQNNTDSRTQRSVLENHRGHVSNKSWVSNGQATERILLVQQAEGGSLNKSHTKGSKSIGRIRPSSRNFDDNSHFSGSLNTSTKITHTNSSYNQYHTLTRDQKNY